jgi:hypothetical protein
MIADYITTLDRTANASTRALEDKICSRFTGPLAKEKCYAADDTSYYGKFLAGCKARSARGEDTTECDTLCKGIKEGNPLKSACDTYMPFRCKDLIQANKHKTNPTDDMSSPGAADNQVGAMCGCYLGAPGYDREYFKPLKSALGDVYQAMDRRCFPTCSLSGVYDEPKVTCPINYQNCSINVGADRTLAYNNLMANNCLQSISGDKPAVPPPPIPDPILTGGTTNNTTTTTNNTTNEINQYAPWAVFIFFVFVGFCCCCSALMVMSN